MKEMSEREMFELLSAEIDELRQALKVRDQKWMEEKASILKEVKTAKKEINALKQQVQKLQADNDRFKTKCNENNGGDQMGMSVSGDLEKDIKTLDVQCKQELKGSMGQASGPSSSFIREVEGNLFSCGDHVSLAHCVSADFHMGKGIAAEFKRRFKGVESLKSQGTGPGEVAFLRHGQRYIYYLVTKQTYSKKSSYETIQKCLAELKTLAEGHKIKELAMPRIGTGLERMEWKELLVIIKDIFKDSNINLTIYEYTPAGKK